MSENNFEISILTVYGADPIYFYRKEDSYDDFMPMEEKRWASVIHNERYLNDQGKKKKRKEYVKRIGAICKAKISPFLQNCETVRLNQSSLRNGTLYLMSLTQLFLPKEIGWSLVALLLCGMRANDLRILEPSFHPILAIDCEPHLVHFLCSLIKGIISLKKWKGKNCFVHRTPIMDLEEKSDKILNFSQIWIKSKYEKSIPIPFPYANTVALVAKSTDSQLKKWGTM